MKAIFEKPIILDGENDNVVLIYSEYIITDITKDIAELTIKKIDNDTFNISERESIIKIEDIFEYEFEKDIDVCIMFGCKDVEGTSYKNIEFKDVETAIKAESLIKDQFKNLGFKRKEAQLSAMSAAITPLVVTAIVAIIGGFFTWCAYQLQDFQPKRNMIVKWHVYLMVKISKAVGYIPFLIISGILVVLCLFWVFKRMSNPPIKISATK